MFFSGLIEEDITVGEAFRNARNRYLPIDGNATFFWNPPLPTFNDDSEGGAKVLDKKYVNFYEYNIFGDPAFNPHVPANRR
jgi:hypothetical protein